MKNIKLLTLLLAMILLFASCEKSDYKNVIPADAKAVVGINGASIYEKGELEHSTFFAILRGALALSMDNGIDFRYPVYLFATADDCVGVTMKMGDRTAFESTLDLWRKEQDFVSAVPVERDGMMWTSAFGDFDLVYTDDICLMLTSMKSEGSALSKQTAHRLMTLDSDERFINTDRYVKMQKQANKDIVAIGDILGMPQLANVVNELFSKGVNVNDIETLVTLNFETGKLVLASEIMSEDEKVNHWFDSLNTQFHKIEGRYIDAPAEDFLLWASLGIKGNTVLNVLKQDAQIRNTLGMLGMVMDIDKMIKVVDGDVAVMLPSLTDLMTIDDEMPKFTLLANVDNTDFMADADYWVESMNKMNNPHMKMQKLDINQYLLNTDNIQLHWGVDGDNLFFATVNDYGNSPFVRRSTLLREYADEIQRNNLFVYINLQTFPMYELVEVMQMNLGYAQLLDKFKAAIIKSSSVREYKVELILKNNQENVLKQLIPKR